MPSGNGEGQIVVKGEVVETVAEPKIVEALVDHAGRLIESGS
ncbi:hypothetical protein [Pseudonocardia spinosispora]